MVLDGGRRRMSQTVRFQETLRRLVIFHEGLAGAAFGMGVAETAALDRRTAALPQFGQSVPAGAPDEPGDR